MTNVSIVLIVIILTALHIFRSVTRASVSVVDKANFTASQSGMSILQALVEVSAIISLGVAQVITKGELSSIGDGWAGETEHFLWHATRSQGNIREFTDAALIKTND